MRLALLVLFFAGCAGASDDKPADTGEADADTDTDSDTDTDTTPVDRDGDSYPSSTDCDDTRADVNPGVTADVCNGRDDDCDLAIDEDPDLGWYLDTDGDGFGKQGEPSFVACEAGSGAYAGNNGDCDDGDATTWPGADEICDGADNDCDGAADDDEAYWTAFYVDADGDGAGSEEIVYGCDAASVGGVTNAWDCDDADRTEPIFVSTAGSATGRGTVADPQGSIERAIGLADTCVKVAAGTYYEDVDFGGRSVTVESLDGAAYTTIQGTGAAPVVTFQRSETADAVLRGFTITGGGGYQSSSVYTYWDGSQYVTYYYSYATGGGIYVSYASPTLEELVVTANTLPDNYGYYNDAYTEYYYGGSSGGGLYVYGGEVTLTDVDFVANNAGEGAALTQYYAGALVGTRVRALENTGDYGTFYSVYSAATWRNLVMDANTSNYGQAGIYSQYDTLDIQNATLVGGEYALYNYGSAVTLDSSIVYANDVGLYDGYPGTSTWALTYNDVYSNGGRNYEGLTDLTGVDGNLSVSPGFEAFTDDGNADDDDLTLSSRSTLIDGGNPGIVDADGTAADVGAYGGPGGDW